MPPVGEAYVDFRARTDKMVEDAAKGGQEAAAAVVKNFLSATAAVEVARGAIRGLTVSFNEAAEAARGQRQTEAVLRSTGEAAGVTAAHVDDLTNRLERKNAVDGDAIRVGTNLLLTFTNIRNEAGKGNDVFDRTNQVMVDMAAAMGTDVSGAAVQLGKALNNPLQGLTALTRVGVSFSDEQRRMIESMVAANDMMGAQKIILDELEREFGGSAEAQATAADRARVAIGNMAETIGTAVVPVVEVAAKVITALAEGISALPGPVSAGVVVVGGLAAGLVAASKAVEVYQGVTATLGPILSAARGAMAAKTAVTSADAVATFAAANAAQIQAISTASVVAPSSAAAAAGGALAAANTSVAASGTAAGVGMTAMLGPIGLVVAATAAVAGAVFLFTRRKDEQAEAIKRVESALISESGTLNSATDALTNYIAAQSRFDSRNQKDDIDRLGLSYSQLTSLLEAGAQGYDAFVARAREAGEVTEGQRLATGQLADAEGDLVDSKRALTLANGEVLVGNVDLIRSFELEQKALQDAARAGVDEIRRRQDLSEAAIDLAVRQNTAAETGTNWIGVNRALTAEIEAAAKAANVATADTFGYAAALEQTVSSAYDAGAAVRDFKAATDGAINAAFGIAEATQSYERAVQQATRTTKGGGGAQRDAAKDARQMEDALKAVEDAEEALALAIEKRALVQQGPTMNQVRIAEIEARQAKRDLADATDAATDAQVALNEAMSNTTPAAVARATEAAERAVAAAQRDVERANIAVRDAQTRLNEARESGDADAIREAELDLADAQDRVFETTGRAESAQRNLQTAQQLGEAASRAAEQATRAVEGAQDAVTLASIDAQSAEENLTRVRNIGKDGSLELARANEEVDAAQRAVEQANQRVMDLEAQMNGQRSGGGGTIETTASVEAAALGVARAGRDMIAMYLEMGAPQETIDRGLQRIREDLDKVTSSSPEARAAAEAMFQTIAAEADTASFKVRDVQRAAEELKAVLDAGYRQSIEIALGIPQPPPASAITGQRASGGPVRSGGLYLVGERGPELIQMGGDAAVFPNDQLRSALSGMSAGGGDTVQVFIGNVQGTREQAAQVASLTGAAVGRVLAARRLAVDVRGRR